MSAWRKNNSSLKDRSALWHKSPALTIPLSRELWMHLIYALFEKVIWAWQNKVIWVYWVDFCIIASWNGRQFIYIPLHCRFCMFKETHSLATGTSTQPTFYSPPQCICKCWLAPLKEKKKKEGNSVCTLLFRNCSGIIFKVIQFFIKNHILHINKWFYLCKKKFCTPFPNLHED